MQRWLLTKIPISPTLRRCPRWTAIQAYSRWKPARRFRSTAGPSGMGLNKFSRMPGDITSLQLIPSIGYGVSHWFSIFFQMNAYDYIHVGAPSLLSLSSASAANPQYQNTIYKSIIPSSGFPPAYVEDAPFASHNGSGVGELDFGFKIGLLSERRGRPISLSIRNDFYIPTQTGLSSLLSDQVQYGKFNYGVGLEASKTFLHGGILATANWSYRFTRSSSFTESIGGTPQTVVLNLADQMQVGAGLADFSDQALSDHDGVRRHGLHRAREFRTPHLARAIRWTTSSASGSTPGSGRRWTWVTGTRWTWRIIETAMDS